MKIQQTIWLFVLFLGMQTISLAASNPRIGNLYYNQVCNSCHKAAGADIKPNSQTVEDWAAYFAIDNHQGGLEQG